MAGTVFAKEEIRLVDFFDTNWTLSLRRMFWQYTTRMYSGMIGKIGTILGESESTLLQCSGAGKSVATRRRLL